MPKFDFTDDEVQYIKERLQGSKHHFDDDKIWLSIADKIRETPPDDWPKDRPWPNARKRK